MFGLQCGHLNKLALIYLSLQSLQLWLAESMGREEWAHLFWDIFVDLQQFFGTLTDAEDLAAGVLLVSNLATTILIIQAHIVLTIWDIPLRWLLVPQAPAAPPSHASKLGLEAGTKRKTGERDDGVGGRGGGGLVAGELLVGKRTSWSLLWQTLNNQT